VVCRRQTTRDRRIRAFGGLPFQQYLNCLVEAPPQNIGCGRKRENSRALYAGFVRQMKTVNRIKKKLRAHTLVKVVPRSPELIELTAFGQQRSCIERAVPRLGLVRKNDADQPAHQRCSAPRDSMLRNARVSRTCESTSTRSRP